MRKFHRTRGAAKFLNCSMGRLAKARSDGSLDIPYVKMGGMILYDEDDLIEWLENQKHRSTSEYQTKPGPGRPRKQAQ